MYPQSQSDATQVYDDADQWAVNVADDDTRTMSAAEVALEVARGHIDPHDAYVWRDGMTDWIPLTQSEELQTLIAQQQGVVQQAPLPQDLGPAPGPDPEGGLEDDLGATRVADDPEDLAGTVMVGGGGGPAEEVPHTMASSGNDYGEAPEPDLFAEARPTAASSAPPSSRRVGERNEASSLFSIDDLRAEADAKQKEAKQKSQPSAGGDDPFGDIVPPAGIAFEPPPIHAPAPPKPAPKPQPPAQPASAPPSVAPMSAQAAVVAKTEQPKKGKAGLIIGAVAGVLLIAGAGAAFFLLGGGGEPAASASAETEPAGATEGADEDAQAEDDEPAEEPEATEEDASEEEEASADEDEADEEGETEEAEDETEEAEDEGASSQPVTANVGSHGSSDSSDDEPEEKEEKEEEKEEKKEPKGEFDPNAARSALSSAAGAASGCKKEGGPTGKGRVTVTFAPSGRATQATVGPPFAGTSVGSCAASAFRSATVPPFEGSSVTVSKSFYIR